MLLKYFSINVFFLDDYFELSMQCSKKNYDSYDTNIIHYMNTCVQNCIYIFKYNTIKPKDMKSKVKCIFLKYKVFYAPCCLWKTTQYIA